MTVEYILLGVGGLLLLSVVASKGQGITGTCPLDLLDDWHARGL